MSLPFELKVTSLACDPVPRLGGASESYEASIQLEDGKTAKAHLKVLNKRQLFNEIGAALLARAVGLPIPDFYLVEAAASQFAGSTLAAMMRPEQEIRVWASCYMGHPPLARHLITHQARAIERLARLPRIHEAILFDEWVANVDRTPGNLLLAPPQKPARKKQTSPDAIEEFYLIDHEQCFSGSNWTCAQLQPNQCFVNELADMLLQVFSDAQKSQLCETAHVIGPTWAQCRPLRAPQQLAKEPKTKRLISPIEAEALLMFLSTRGEKLEMLMSQRLGTPLLEISQ